MTSSSSSSPIPINNAINDADSTGSFRRSMSEDTRTRLCIGPQATVNDDDCAPSSLLSADSCFASMFCELSTRAHQGFADNARRSIDCNRSIVLTSKNEWIGSTAEEVTFIKKSELFVASILSSIAAELNGDRDLSASLFMWCRKSPGSHANVSFRVVSLPLTFIRR